MKTTSKIAALVSLALFALASAVQAQYKPIGDDGIAASPKLRQFLDEHKKHPIPVALAEVARMACPKCKDQATTRVDYSARGANKPTVLVVSHLCKGCGTDWKLEGHGKARHSVVVHKCADCGEKNLACCSTNKGGTVATKGMEKEITVAPLK